MSCVSFQLCFHLKVVKNFATKLWWRRRSFGKCELMFDGSAVSFKFVTLKRKRAFTFPYSWVSQRKEVFRVFFKEMNCTLLISVLRLLNIPSLVIFTSGDWRNYNTQITLKVDKAISYRFWWRTHGFGSVCDITLRKRDINLCKEQL